MQVNLRTSAGYSAAGAHGPASALGSGDPRDRSRGHGGAVASQRHVSSRLGILSNGEGPQGSFLDGECQLVGSARRLCGVHGRGLVKMVWVSVRLVTWRGFRTCVL